MANLPLLLDISRKHLVSRFRQSLIAALGVTFGIGTFIILMSFMTGLNGLLDGLTLNRTPHVHIFNEIKPSEKQPIDYWEAAQGGLNVVRSIKPKLGQLRIQNAMPMMSHLRKDTRVKGLTAQTGAQVFFLTGSIELTGIANGIEPLKEAQLFNFGDYIIEGSPEALHRTSNGVLLGAGIAEKMSVSIGDRIQVSTASGVRQPLKIVGIYQSGLAEIDDTQSYVNLNMAQRLLGEGSNYITDINLKLLDIADAVPMATEVERIFPVTAIDIIQANAQFETGTAIRNLISYAVSATLLIVAGFGIYNILNMMIYEKMNDIAILKATGFSGNDVKIIFISQALVIGLIGGIAGLLLGYGVSLIIDATPFETEALPTIKTFPVNFDPLFYVGGIVFALIATFFAGYLPAHKAQGIDPVEIIRGQ